MLKILDRYIIRKFLSTFFFMLGIIMLLAMVFDIAERLSDFIEKQASFKAIVFDYYLNFLLYYGNTFSSMIVFIAVIWFTAKMAQDAEIIPMLFSGRPFIRIIRPYMIAATILMLLSLVLNHFVLPRANRVRLDFEESFYRDRLLVENYNAEFPGNELVHYSTYNSEENMINDFVIERYDSQNRLIHFMKARTASVIPGVKRWRLTDVFERKVSYSDTSGTSKGEMESIIQKHQLTENHLKDTTLPYNVDDIAVRDNVVEAMTFRELSSFIAKEKAKGNPSVAMYEIELYQRSSYPFATYVLTLIGVSVSSRKKRGGIGINIAIGLLFVFIYIFAMKITTVAATTVGFPSVAAVWLPNVMFGILALFLYRIAPK
ncbi:LptF/LptG family permease [Fluviicola taffensis]|uniref:Permease YjgP/YjgQ family protein n=1 Tax=Fluviicola taffensis (strain DSM 16823 / NCIMB 13979 / RW262) TaxID=755732 RepID=F2IHA8_FLUTR|nr:LptF/LptG family permease [Fluviicola taffensis]AEA42663.1 permease YjgP/YjgQ family protein [Fluviicola taffensis DSM 16823]